MLSPGVFSETYVPTPAIQLYKGRSSFGGGNCDLEIFDPPGKIETDPSRLNTYQVIDVVLVCFSLADKQSFDSARARWWEETKFNKAFENKGILLVGLKSDLADWMSQNDPAGTLTPRSSNTSLGGIGRGEKKKNHIAQRLAARTWMVQVRREAQGFTKSLKADKYYETSARTLGSVVEDDATPMT